MDSSNLSAILKKKRGLPSSRALAIAKKLKLSPKEASLFVSSTLRKQLQLDSIKTKEEVRKYLLEEKYFKIISEWEYYGLLQLMTLPSFSPEIKWISRRLKISETRTNSVLKHLEELEFIKADAKKGYVRTTPSLETSEDVESLALQKSHIESLTLGKEKLETTPVELRDFSSITIAIDSTKVPEAKVLIREFQEKLYTLLSTNNKNEVYQFNCQLFPLTEV